MTEHVPDIIERGALRCDNWAADNATGDSFTCCCGSLCKLKDVDTLSPDPYALPVRPSCFEKEMDGKFGLSWRDKSE